MWHVTCDMQHKEGGEHCLKTPTWSCAHIMSAINWGVRREKNVHLTNNLNLTKKSWVIIFFIWKKKENFNILVVPHYIHYIDMQMKRTSGSLTIWIIWPSSESSFLARPRRRRRLMRSWSWSSSCSLPPSSCIPNILLGVCPPGYYQTWAKPGTALNALIN